MQESLGGRGRRGEGALGGGSGKRQGTGGAGVGRWGKRWREAGPWAEREGLGVHGKILLEFENHCSR